MKQGAGHAQVGDEPEAAGEAKEQVLAATGQVVDAAADDALGEGGGRDVADDARGVGSDADAGDGAAAEQREEVAADGLDFREFRHGQRFCSSGETWASLGSRRHSRSRPSSCRL